MKNIKRNAFKAFFKKIIKEVVRYFHVNNSLEEEFNAREKEIDLEIQEEIGMFTEEQQKGIIEDYRIICKIQNKYERKYFKRSYLEHLKYCEESKN